MSSNEELLVAVLYDYDASDLDELTIRKGDLLFILEQYDDGWCLVRSDVSSGLIPSNYVREEGLEPVEQARDTTSKRQSNSRVDEGKTKKTSKNKLAASTDMETLKQLREEAEEKVNALSMAIKQNTSEITLGGSQGKTRGVSDKLPAKEADVHRFSRLQSTPVIPSVQSSQLVAQRSQGHGQGQGQGALQKVSLEPSSLKFISDIITERINHEFALRDSKLMEKVRTMINSSQTLPGSGSTLRSPSFDAEMDARSRHSLPPGSQIPSPHKQSRNGSNTPQSVQKPSKIPVRLGGGYGLGLPRITPPTADRPNNRDADFGAAVTPTKHSSQSSRAASGAGNGNGARLPILHSKGSHKKAGQDRHSAPDGVLPLPQHIPGPHVGPSANVNPSSIMVEPSTDGVQYSNCRSRVYGPTEPFEAPDPLPGAKLALHHVYGYDGDFTRHGSSIKGKNVLWVDSRRVVYPAAAVVVVQEVAGDRRQGFFCGHSDDVTCVAVHPQRTLAASGQKGKDCCVLVWDVTKAKRGVSLNRHVVKLKPPNASRGISGVDFSGDGKFLLAVGMDDQRTIMVFDWREGVLLASCKAGHGDVSQVRFNPYLYSPMEQHEGVDPSCRGCYTLVSYGGKQVKFWTLKEYYGAEEAGLEGVSNFKGRPLKPRKGENQNLSLKYALEGTMGVLPSKAANAPDVTALVIVNDNLDTGGWPKSRLFFGTSAGSIYVWQQLEEGESIKRGGKSKARRKDSVPVPPIDGLGAPAWQPRGKLISVVMELHDSAIVDMDYIRINPYEGLSGADPSYMIERIISSGDDGIINVWLLNRNETSNSLPLDHLGYLELNKEYARTVCWDDGGHAAVLGTAENSVLLLSYEEEEIGADEGEEGESIRPKIAIDVLMQSHNGKVRKLAVNPVIKSLVASTSSDKIVRLWDFRDRSLLTCFVLPDAATAAVFSIDGRGLALGNEKGELAIYECDELNQLVGNYPCRFTPADFAGAHWKMVFKRSLAPKNASDSPGKKRASKKCEIMEMRYSPLGNMLALGCRDHLVHLLSVHNGFKHIAVCRGHSAFVRSIDFSSDGAMVQTSDAGKEVMFWDAKGQRVLNAAHFRDVAWESASSVYGYNAQGVFNNSDAVPAVDGDINCVDRSPDCQWLVSGGSNTVHHAIKLFNYPCLPDAIPSFHGGHTSPVLDVKVLDTAEGTTEVATAGGNDSCVFQWRLLEYGTPRRR